MLFPKHIQDPTDLYFGSGQRSDLEKVVHPHLNELTQDELFAADRAYELGKQIAQTLGQDFAIESQLLPWSGLLQIPLHPLPQRLPHRLGGLPLCLQTANTAPARTKRFTLNLEGHGLAPSPSTRLARKKWPTSLTTMAGLSPALTWPLDFFDGLKGGFDRVKSDFLSGKMDCHGRRPAGRANEDLNEKKQGLFLLHRHTRKRQAHQRLRQRQAAIWLRRRLELVPYRTPLRQSKTGHPLRHPSAVRMISSLVLPTGMHPFWLSMVRSTRPTTQMQT